MPFKFNHICRLLKNLECHNPPLLQSRKQGATRKTATDWLAQYRSTLDAPDANGVAIPSTLFPERRTDRVYKTQFKHLENIVCRCLWQNKTKTTRLSKWKEAGNGDLGAYAERVQRDADASLGNAPVTVDDVDNTLQQIASQCKFSGLEVQA